MKLTDEMPVTMTLRSWIVLGGVVISAVWYVAAKKIEYDTRIMMLEERVENVRNWFYTTQYPDDPWSVNYRNNHPRFGS